MQGKLCSCYAVLEVHRLRCVNEQLTQATNQSLLKMAGCDFGVSTTVLCLVPYLSMCIIGCMEDIRRHNSCGWGARLAQDERLRLIKQPGTTHPHPTQEIPPAHKEVRLSHFLNVNVHAVFQVLPPTQLNTTHYYYHTNINMHTNDPCLREIRIRK